MSFDRPTLSDATEGFLARRARGEGMMIRGVWVAAQSTIATFDPATGDENGIISRASSSDVDAAVAAARAAFPG